MIEHLGRRKADSAEAEARNFVSFNVDCRCGNVGFYA